MAVKKINGRSGDNFIEGALIGAALGVAAGIFAGTKTGKKIGREVAHDAKRQSVEFYRYVAPKLRKAKRMSEREYKAFLKKAMVGYSRGKKMSAVETARLLKEVQSSWKHLRREFK